MASQVLRDGLHGGFGAEADEAALVPDGVVNGVMPSLIVVDPIGWASLSKFKTGDDSAQACSAPVSRLELVRALR